MNRKETWLEDVEWIEDDNVVDELSAPHWWRSPMTLMTLHQRYTDNPGSSHPVGRCRYGETPTTEKGGTVASADDVRQALLDEIERKLKEDQTALGLLLLAEAYAWVLHPDQAHGAPVSSRS